MKVTQVNEMTEKQRENIQIAHHNYRNKSADFYTQLFIQRVCKNLDTEPIEIAISCAKDEVLSIMKEASSLRAHVYNTIPAPAELDLALKLSNVNAKPQKETISDVNAEESSN